MPPRISKDFDAERLARLKAEPTAPTFKLGGEVFRVRRTVRPDVIATVEALTADATATEALDALDAAILAFIDPTAKAHERYAAVRSNDTDPVTLEDMTSVLSWLTETYTARPTRPSRRSSSGRRPTGTSSTARSRSEAGVT